MINQNENEIENQNGDVLTSFPPTEPEFGSLGYTLEDAVVSVNASHFDLYERAKHDYGFYIGIMLADKLTTPVPDFHIQIFGMLVDLNVKRGVSAVPRGHAKTTMAKLGCHYLYVYTDVTTIYYISSTLEHAAKSCLDIKNFLLSPNSEALYGKVRFLVEQDQKGVWKFVLENGKVCYLRALGANQQVRGANVENTRIQVAIVDDLEDRKDNKNNNIYAELKEWFYTDFIKALDKKFNKVFQIGNIVGANSLVYEHVKSPRWSSILYSAIKPDGTSLWEAVFPLKEIIDDYDNYAEMGLTAQWFGEMMNIYMPTDSTLILPRDITYLPRPEANGYQLGFITVDPAISDNLQTAHKTAVAVHLLVGQTWQIADYVVRQAIDPIELYYIIHRLAARWGLTVVGIESEGYQAALKYVFDYLQNMQGDNLLEFVQMPTGKKHKYARIAAWVGYLKRGEYALTKGDVTSTTQLTNYDPTSKKNDDDLIDVEAYGVYMITTQLALITAASEAPTLAVSSTPIIQLTNV